ncbi:glutathione S-transferase family protein [Piscinibacter sp.]|uniref:glutathione S-transferase family protein n=1 Tax=Piscinibacter sp. TaxID=1903157 RepID=UPI002C06EB89|nr:glutathione S-transferase [Albitalea sp.]HUG22358.1 glutathione S-transferase [Albitalea sp.]
MYTLFGSPGCGSAVVEIALEQAGAPYRLVHASSWEPDSALAELEKANPLKQIPTLVLPDGSVMSESAAILIHLGLEFPDARLLPTESAARAQAIRGLVFIAANCYAAIGICDYPERWCIDASDDEKKRIVAAARRRLHQHWDVFADIFPAQPFLSGAEAGALDFLAVVVSKWSGARAHLRSARPGFFAVLERIEKHPVVASAFVRHWPG